MVKGEYVDLMVKFCVAKFKEGNPVPREKLDKIIANSIDSSNQLVANLSRITSHHELADMILTLSNKGCFDLFCLRLNVARNILKNIKTLNLSCNDIQSLEPMSKLINYSFYAIDFRYNKISSIENFCFLKSLNLQELVLIGNPVTEEPMYMEKIKEILPTLKKIDGRDMGHQKIALVVPAQSVHADNRSDPINVFNLAHDKIIRSSDINDHVKKEFPKYLNDNCWIKVVILHKGKVSKIKILEEMNKQFFKRIPFFPCYYKESKKSDSFMLRKNCVALKTLVENHLSMEINSLNCKLDFEIHLNHAEYNVGQISWKEKINYVIKKRIKDFKLHLDDFAEDIDFNELEISMSTVCSLEVIVKSIMMINSEIITISLQNNKISSIEGLRDLKFFPKLVSLDLRNNCIESFRGFPQTPTLLQLNLDKNPICLQYYDEPWRYVHDILEIFPNLQHIDGRRINRTMTPVVFMQNYFVSQSLYTLTENFIKHFFELFDSGSRKSLKKLYVNNSIFRITTEFNRSEIAFCNFSYSVDQTNTHIGNECILEVFEHLPPTEHDFTTMCVDVPLMTEKNILIHVNGFVKETGKNLNDEDIIYGFSRTFYLECQSQKTATLSNVFTYCIKNEQLNIRCVTSEDLNKAFKKTVVTDDEMSSICKDLMPVKSQEEEANILLLNELTQLDMTWCKRFVIFSLKLNCNLIIFLNRILEDANWDIKLALKNFNSFVDQGFLTIDDFKI